MAGLPESPLQNIKLENVNAIGKYGCKANNIRGLVLNNVNVISRDGDEKFVLNNVSTIE